MSYALFCSVMQKMEDMKFIHMYITHIYSFMKHDCILEGKNKYCSNSKSIYGKLCGVRQVR